MMPIRKLAALGGVKMNVQNAERKKTIIAEAHGIGRIGNVTNVWLMKYLKILTNHAKGMEFLYG